MKLNWEYIFEVRNPANLVAKLKTESGSLIFSVYENNLGFSTVISDDYCGFIHSDTCFYPDIDEYLLIHHISLSRENKVKFACIKLEEYFYAQRKNIAEKLYLNNNL